MEKLWYRQSLEGLFIRGLGAKMNPSLRAALLECAIDIERLEQTYPSQVAAKAIRLTASLVFPDRSQAQALEEVGRAFIFGYAHTLVGGAVVQLARVLGPTRTIRGMQRNFRSGGNYVETRFSSLGAHSAELWMNDTSGIPDFWAGVMRHGAHYARAKAMRVSYVAAPDDTCVFRFDWEE